MDRWEFLINYIEMIVDFGQLILTGAAVYLAWDYLNQHSEKLSLERKRLAAENGLRALIKMDQVMQTFFSAVVIKAHEDFQKIVDLSNAPWEGLTLAEREQGQKHLFVAYVFRYNFPDYQNDLWSHHKELKVNGMLLKDPLFDTIEREYDEAMSKIFTTILFDSRQFIEYKLSYGTYDWVKTNIPLGMSDSKNKHVIQYDKAGLRLKDFFLSKT